MPGEIQPTRGQTKVIIYSLTFVVVVVVVVVLFKRSVYNNIDSKPHRKSFAFAFVISQCHWSLTAVQFVEGNKCGLL